MRIPITTSLSIEQFSSGLATIKQSGTINAIYGQRADGTVYATQRPGVNIYLDCSGAGISDTKGRGIYYWPAASAYYFVNDDTVYKGDYASPLAQTITSGIERVEFFEVGAYLVILDAENNKGWYINSSASTTLVEITDVDFPPKQTPALTITKGGSSLNNTLYVGCTNGEIWNSAVEDPTTWGSADFTTAEVSTDAGVMIFPHSDHIAALGTKSCEFFYDNANATGSPLNVRTDVHHEIGAADFSTAWVEDSTVYFVGQTPSGSLAVYLMSNFAVQKVSGNDFDSMLTTALITDGAKAVGSGFTAGGMAYYVLTIYFETGGIVTPTASYVFGGGWSEWELMHTGIDDFPLIDWTDATETRAGTGMLSNGDLITIVDDFSPVDVTDSSVYIADGYIDVGYYASAGADGVNVSMEIITGQGDSNTMETKFSDRLRVVCTPTDSSQTVTVQWSDEGNNNYNTGRTIDISNPKNKLNRCGSYKFRNYKLTYGGSEKVEIEGIEAEIRL